MDLTRINHHKKTFDEIVHFIKGEDGKEHFLGVTKMIYLHYLKTKVKPKSIFY